MEQKYDEAFGGGDYYSPARVQGHMWVQKPTSAAIDKAHQFVRRSFNLPELPIRREPGGMDKAAIELSFDEIAHVIRRRANSEPRDLRGIAAWLLLLGFLLQLIGAVL